MRKLIVFMLFACIMLTTGVSSFTYATQTDPDISGLTADKQSVEKAVYTDYAAPDLSVAICGAVSEIEKVYSYTIINDRSKKTFDYVNVRLYRLARDSLICTISESNV